MTSTLTNCAAELAEFAQPEKKGGRSPREERIIAGFEEIQRFVEKHGRAPQHGEDRDIFERLYAVRLDRLRALEECRALLAPLDHQGLLAGARAAAAARGGAIDMTTLAAELAGAAERSRHHRTAPCPHQRRQARRRGDRQPPDVRGLRDVQAAVRARADGPQDRLAPVPAHRSRKPRDRGRGLLHSRRHHAYVAEVGEPLKTTAGEVDRRLRVIFDNGTESNLLLRSLQRALLQGPRRAADHLARERATLLRRRVRSR